MELELKPFFYRCCCCFHFTRSIAYAPAMPLHEPYEHLDLLPGLAGPCCNVRMAEQEVPLPARGSVVVGAEVEMPVLGKDGEQLLQGCLLRELVRGPVGGAELSVPKPLGGCA